MIPTGRWQPMYIVLIQFARSVFAAKIILLHLRNVDKNKICLDLALEMKSKFPKQHFKKTFLIEILSLNFSDIILVCQNEHLPNII